MSNLRLLALKTHLASLIAEKDRLHHKVTFLGFFPWTWPSSSEKQRYYKLYEEIDNLKKEIAQIEYDENPVIVRYSP